MVLWTVILAPLWVPVLVVFVVGVVGAIRNDPASQEALRGRGESIL